jgi:hypothetical protein
VLEACGESPYQIKDLVINKDGINESYPGPDPRYVIPDVMICDSKQVNEAPHQAYECCISDPLVCTAS